MLFNPSVDQMYRLAAEHHQAGRINWAQDLYQQILSFDPNHGPTRQSLEKCSARFGSQAPKELSAARRFPSLSRRAKA